MTKEYHVFTHQESTHEQAFVFEVDRLSDGGLELDELWLITIQNTGEVRTRVQFGRMLDCINKTIGGNVEDIETVVDLFSDILPVEKLDEIGESIRETEQNNLDIQKLLDSDEIITFMDHKHTNK